LGPAVVDCKWGGAEVKRSGPKGGLEEKNEDQGNIKKRTTTSPQNPSERGEKSTNRKRFVPLKETKQRPEQEMGGVQQRGEDQVPLGGWRKTF